MLKNGSHFETQRSFKYHQRNYDSRRHLSKCIWISLRLNLCYLSHYFEYYELNHHLSHRRCCCTEILHLLSVMIERMQCFDRWFVWNYLKKKINVECQLVDSQCAWKIWIVCVISTRKMHFNILKWSLFGFGHNFVL